jgi:hypothetical protein
VEVKSVSGKLSRLQMLFNAECGLRGAFYFAIKSMDDLVAAF